MKILVIDKIGDGFMANWSRLFKALDIKHLRSPLFFHPCLADLDSLLAFAQRTERTTVADGSSIASSAVDECSHQNKTSGKSGRGRDCRIKQLGFCAVLDGTDGVNGLSSNPSSAQPDLVDIAGVIVADRSKHKKCRQRLDPKNYGRIVGATGGAVNERERKDYFNPSTELFSDFVRHDLMKRYGISDQGAWANAEDVLGQLASCEVGDEPDAHLGDAGDIDRPEIVASPVRRSPAQTVKGEVCSMKWSELHVEG